MRSKIVKFSKSAHPAEVTEERLERALMNMAYIITLHGEVYAPLFDRIERELLEMRQKTTATERARRLLEMQTVSVQSVANGGGVKAIC